MKSAISRARKRLKINIASITLNDVEQNGKKILDLRDVPVLRYFSMPVDFVSS